ncbi:hypothetical protein RF11_07877 [Thelohanellus kitauei]|uniref:Programmed cell death protein 10 dimerisation domain-containing protein n=1 Tax=Thelohanellus kitauei TaxID=669202 RepID=A0A0C2MNJ7_THEKT|nr:hypothetical protein RF11_07877 [Thelohanellus kitauei]
MSDPTDPKEHSSRLPFELFIKPVLADNEVKSSISILSLLSTLNNCDKQSPGFTKDFIDLIMHEVDIETPFSFVCLNAWTELEIKISDPELASLNKTIDSYRKTLKSMLSNPSENSQYFLCIKSTANMIKEIQENWKKLAEKYFEGGKNAEYKRSLNECRRMFLLIARRLGDTFKTTLKEPNVRMIVETLLPLTFRLHEIMETVNKLVV